PRVEAEAPATGCGLDRGVCRRWLRWQKIEARSPEFRSRTGSSEPTPAVIPRGLPRRSRQTASAKGRPAPPPPGRSLDRSPERQFLLLGFAPGCDGGPFAGATLP